MSTTRPARDPGVARRRLARRRREEVIWLKGYLAGRVAQSVIRDELERWLAQVLAPPAD